jgi:hypothetical protein
MSLKNIYIAHFFFYILISCASNRKDFHNQNSELDSTENYPFMECYSIVNYSKKIKCIYQLAFFGDNRANMFLLDDLNKNSSLVYYRTTDEYRLRGKALFNEMMNLAKNFECDEREIAKMHFLIDNLYDMIDEIDGMSNVKIYINARMPTTISKLKDVNCSLDTVYKLTWNILNTAWKEGKIKLKDFGQE